VCYLLTPYIFSQLQISVEFNPSVQSSYNPHFLCQLRFQYTFLLSPHCYSHVTVHLLFQLSFSLALAAVQISPQYYSLVQSTFKFLKIALPTSVLIQTCSTQEKSSFRRLSEEFHPRYFYLRVRTDLEFINFYNLSYKI
jgi:hypothetical protein